MSDADDPQYFSGQCLCGAAKYQAQAIGTRIGHCHCSMCRKFHGAAFATFAEAASDQFTWLQGEDNLQSYTASNGSTRRFCATCGSSMTFEPADNPDNLIEFALGTLDSGPSITADAHLYTDNCVNWHTINDHLPRHPQGR